MFLHSIPSKLAAAGLLLSCLRPQLGLPSLLGVSAASDFAWEALTASENFTWTACYDIFECSMLQVPVDYSSSSAGNASIAVVRFPSNSSKSDYRGPILFNPGGPGSSGVSVILEVGAQFATIFGSEYDIVGLDPRGINHSTPTISLFKTPAERALWSPDVPDTFYPSLNESSDAVPHQWARSVLLGTIAAARDEDNYLQHVTTDNVARDMLRITEAFGEEKLQYWGVSYGSVIGATFATLFPDKVGRMVIDGVADMDSWFSGNLTLELTDADKALQTFFDGCAAAGPSDCAFYAPSAADIAANLTAITTAIQTQPFPVVTNTSYGIVDYSSFHNLLFAALAKPYVLFQPMGKALALLAAGVAEPLWDSVGFTPFECDCNSTEPIITDNTFEASLAVRCGDAVPINDTVAELKAFYADARAVSSFADLASVLRVQCSGWKVPQRDGVFHGPVGANTSFPLLIIGNTADPLTPIVGAESTAALFPGSVLLTQNSPGHTSLAAASLCTAGYLRQYFQNGTLPAAGTVCSVDVELFPSSSNSTAARRALHEDLFAAVRAIGHSVLPIATRIFPRSKF